MAGERHQQDHPDHQVNEIDKPTQQCRDKNGHDGGPDFASPMARILDIHRLIFILAQYGQKRPPSSREKRE
jgi:hypothetical protein